MPHHYLDYTETDFINDPDFQDWVRLRGSNGAKGFWDDFFEKNPSKSEAGRIAEEFLLNLSFKEENPSEDFIEQSLQRHLLKIAELHSKEEQIKVRKLGVRRLLQVAAVTIGVVLSGSLFYLFNQEKIVEKQTAYGEIRSLSLSDSTSIVLNANSEIRYLPKWDKGSAREVWLKGEAFFDVRHINTDTNQIHPYEHFFVHTNNLTVEVLGTAFDIRNRRNFTQVVLERGVIKISFNDKSHKSLILMPGDIVTYDSLSNSVTKSKIKADDFSAWKDKKLILSNPSVSEIIGYLQDNYGKTILLEDPGLGNRKIEGPIILNNLEDALFIISTVLNTDIIKKDSTIIIRSR